MITNKTPLTIQDPRGQIYNEKLKYVVHKVFEKGTQRQHLGKTS